MPPPSGAAAPDGGWGWVMVACSFTVHLLSTGAHYGMGVLYVSWLAEFGEGKGTTSWIVSVAVALTFVCSPIPASLMERFGGGPVQVLGAVLVSLGYVIASQATSVLMLIMSVGVIGGIGSGFCYLPSISIVAQYFNKRRGIAYGLATSGVGIGAFVFSPLLDYLESEFGWRGALLITGGLALHMAICGMLMRPAPTSSQEVQETEIGECHACSDADLLLEDGLETKLASADHLWSSDAKCESVTEVGSRYTIGDITSENYFISGEKENHNNVLPKDVQSNSVSCVTNGASFTENDKTANGKEDVLQQQSNGGKLLTRSERNLNHVLLTPRPVRGGRHYASAAELTSRDLFKTKYKNNALAGDISYRHLNILLSGSVHSLLLLDKNLKKSQKLSIDTVDKLVAVSGDKVHFVQDESSITAAPSKRGVFARGIDYFLYFFSLLKDKVFLLLAISNFLTNLSYIMPVLYMVDRAVEYDISKSTAAMLISVNGVANVIGRLGAGLLADRVNIDIVWIYMTFLTLCGLFTALSALCEYSFVAHAVYAACFGITIGGYTTLAPPVTVTLMGVERVAQMYSLLLVFMGVSGAIGPPLAGWLFDITGDFIISFVLHGVAIIVSAVVMLPVALARQRRRGQSS